LEHVRQVAEWAELEKTPLWHTRLAYIIEEIVGFDGTIDDYQFALKMDPDFGQAYYALATTHGELGDYDSAINEMKESCRLGYPTKKGSPTSGAIYISIWQQARTPSESGTGEALKTLEDELERNPDDFPCIGAYLTVAYKSHRYKTVMSTIQKLGTKLPDFLISEDAKKLHTGIRRSAQKTHRVGFMKRAYEIAIETSQGMDNSALTIRLLDAIFQLYSENQEDDQAIGALDQTLKAVDDGTDNYFVLRSIQRKAEIYFNRAWSKSGTVKESTNALNELIQLEKDEHPLDANSITGYLNGLLLGLVYRLKGEEDKARPFFRERIALAMTLLDDDDISNDYSAWEILRDTLTKAGEFESGAACAGLFLIEIKRLVAGDTEHADTLSEAAEEPDTDKPDSQEASDNTPPSAEEATEATSNGQLLSPGQETTTKLVQHDLTPDDPKSKSSEEPDLYLDTPWDWGTCDGPCERDMSKYDSGIHSCTYCLDIYFCKDCFPLHQSGSLSYKICDADHEFVYVVGAPKDLPDDKVKVGSKIRDRAEWLGEIRKKWDLPPKKQDPDVKESSDVAPVSEGEKGDNLG
jgi:tetratricopeptide (TPR) repeat protein